MEFWDLIFKRYSSPFLFLNKLLENNKFSSGIDTIYNQKNDDKLWELYLSILPTMAMSGEVKSFDDWKIEMSNNTTNEEMDLEEIKENSINILNNFKPPE